MTVVEFEDVGLADKIQAKLEKNREGIHLSDLELCLKKSYYRRLYPQPLSLDQAIMYVVGLAVQEYMYPGEEKTYVLDGVDCSPDADGVEVKSTRAAMKNFDPLKPHWLFRMLGYCKVTDKLDWQLSVIFVIPAKMRSWVFSFTPEEIEENWAFVVEKAESLRKALATGIPPEPDYHKDWECGKCEFSGFCLNQIGRDK